MSFLGRLFGKGRRKEEPEAPRDHAEQAPPAGAPQDDLRLMQFAPEQGRTLPTQRRLLELVETLDRDPASASGVTAEEVISLCDGLVGQGELRLAIDLLRQLASRLPRLPALRLRLAELLYETRDFAAALRLLDELTVEPSCRIAAHFLLGDYHGREAEPERALEHYEAVLALDYTYPRARQRAGELRERLDRPVATAAPTILGSEDLGPGSRFLLQRELGRGGSGIVYLAVDRELGRPVAVKALHQRVRDRPEARAHLFCEARIATALEHPGIVAIYDLDEQLNLVVMEYCAGSTLADRLARERGAGGVARLELRQVLTRLAEVCEVLDRVHRCGIVHRDLKPANLLTRDPRAVALPPLVISDFGIAHADRGEPSAQAAAGSLIYMSPEQRGGEAADPRSDLYSCGVILLELLLGRPPLEGAAALAGAPLALQGELWRELEDRLRPGLRPALPRLLRALVDPRLEARPESAATVSATLAALAALEAQQQERAAVAEELRRRAGAAPSAAAARWLEGQLARLTSSDS